MEVQLKSAREMFEELGYEQTKLKKFVKYTYKKYISNWYHIMFDLEEKTIDCYISNDSPFSPTEPFSITTKELKAINKQVEELGWNNE